MAHEAINTITGKAHVAFGREHAWHRLGTHLGRLATADEMISAINPDALEVAEHAYHIVKSYAPIFDANGMPVLDASGNQLMMPQLEQSAKAKAIITASGQEVAGVGVDWQLLKNGEFFDIVRAISGDAACVDSMGILSEGSKIFASLASEKLPSRWIAGDEYKSFLTIMNAHNGTMRFMIFWSFIRVVCANTWKMSLSERKDSDTVFARKHTVNMASDIAVFVRDYDKALEKAQREADKFAEQMEFLHSRQFSQRACENILQDILAYNPNAKKESLARNADGSPRKENERAKNRYESLLDYVLTTSDTNYDEALTGKRIFDSVIEAIGHGGTKAFVPRNTQGMEAGQLQANYELFGKGQLEKEKVLVKVTEHAEKYGMPRAVAGASIVVPGLEAILDNALTSV